jgi:MFS family permease
MVSPFMGDYAQKLGVTSTEMGWFQSSANLSNNMMQVFWGRLSDRLGRRIPSLIGGYMAGYLEGYFGQVVALQIVYMISTAGRALGAVWHLGLDETLKNP